MKKKELEKLTKAELIAFVLTLLAVKESGKTEDDLNLLTKAELVQFALENQPEDESQDEKQEIYHVDLFGLLEACDAKINQDKSYRGLQTPDPVTKAFEAAVSKVKKELPKK